MIPYIYTHSRSSAPLTPDRLREEYWPLSASAEFLYTVLVNVICEVSVRIYTLSRSLNIVCILYMYPVGRHIGTAGYAPRLPKLSYLNKFTSQPALSTLRLRPSY